MKSWVSRPVFAVAAVFVLVFATSCGSTRYAVNASTVKLQSERAATLRAQRECLQRAEMDRNVDCTGYTDALPADAPAPY